jgi:YHS domain-containing protein
MELTLLEASATTLRAGYACPCGCTPSVEYRRGVELVEEGCCCGNHFAVGPGAAASLTPTTGFRPELQTFDAPWGERLQAAWLIGPSVHGPADDHHHDDDQGEQRGDVAIAARSTDPVCGMMVEPDVARVKGLQSGYGGTDHFFCGKGCKLDFDENPGHYLDPGYVPSM